MSLQLKIVLIDYYFLLHPYDATIVTEKHIARNNLLDKIHQNFNRYNINNS